MAAPTKQTAKKAKAAPRGRKARAEAKHRARLEKMRAKSGNRWRIHYDIDGPRVRLGLAWFIGAMVALTVGLAAIVVYFGVAFAAAASHALRTWRARGAAADPRVALGVTAFVIVCAAFGAPAMGLGVLALAAIAVASSISEGNQSVALVLGRAGVVLQTTLPAAVAGGCFLLIADREVWAAIALVLLASAYETGDFLIGSGAANAYEGPLAGLAAVLVTALVVAALGVPPFEGVGQAMAFGLAVAPLAFAGQLLASGMLPHSRAFAPALRRVDSLLLAAPLWYLGIDRVIFG